MWFLTIHAIMPPPAQAYGVHLCMHFGAASCRSHVPVGSFGTHRNKMCVTGLIHEQEVLRQSLHELMIDPLLGSAVPSQVSINQSCWQNPLLHAILSTSLALSKAAWYFLDAFGSRRVPV